MSAGRRGFLQSLAALAAGGFSLRAPLLGGTTAAPATGDQWDMTWRERLTGPYRAVFDSPAVSEGSAFWRAATWKDEVADVYGALRDQIHAIVVVRHKAIPMIMDDEFWNRHEIAKKDKIKDPMTNKDPKGNPFRDAGERTDIPAGLRAAFIDEFLTGGGIILACNFAFGQMVYLEHQREKDLSREDVRARTLSHVIPGVILQPSGFFGALEAQRAGCSLFPQIPEPD